MNHVMNILGDHTCFNLIIKSFGIVKGPVSHFFKFAKDSLRLQLESDHVEPT